MNAHAKVSLSDIRIMILSGFPLSTEECGHLYYDGDGVSKSLEEAYVWYQVAQCAGNHEVDSLVNYLDSKLTTSKCFKLSSRARHIYTQALQH
jgi:TPR repeat protein